jgi:tetratricopeptide (TPR) repeat protein
MFNSPQPQQAGEGADADQASLQAKVISLLQEIYDAQQTAVLMLDSNQRQATGTFENWSLKDTLAHIVAWNDVMNMRLDMLARGEMPVNFENVDQINAEFYQMRVKLSWSAVLESSRKAYNGLVERLRSFSEADLTDPYRYAWLEGKPLWRRVLTSAYVHPLVHLAFFYHQLGQKALGLQLQEDAAQKLLNIDPDPGWQSEVIYNLACQYALSGDKETAISRLRLALQHDPSLLAWSQEDPDFNSIRHDPAFQAIYTEFGT